MVKFSSLNGAEQVTGSAHLLEINGKNYLLDCGAEQGIVNCAQHNREMEFPKVDGVIVSHCHYDHIGLLPKLIKEGYTGKIYSTPVTRDLSSIVLQDSAKIQEFESGTPIYTETDALETMNHYRCSVYGKWKKIDDDLKYTFYNSGHILGSAFINLSITKWKNPVMKFLHRHNNRMNVLYAVDFGRKDSPICNPPETNVEPPDYLILESTYGNKTHSSTDTIYQELSYIINRTIERGGKVIIPSFAVNRTQELIYFIKKLSRQNKIPRVPIYIDSPMAANATGVFNIHSECFNQNIINEFTSKGKNPFSVRTLKFVTDYRESVKLAKSTKPAIIISCNGMCESGRVINHIKYGIGNSNNTVLFVGYQAANTLGRKILDKQEILEIDHKQYNLKCEVQSIPAFSSHGDYKEMIGWLHSIDTSKLKTIFLVHGDKDSLSSFKEKLEKEFPKINIVISEKGKKYIL